MEKVDLEDIRFVDTGDHIEAVFLKVFSFPIDKQELSQLGDFRAVDGALEVEKLDKRFDRILDQGFSKLKSKLNGNKAIYIHRNSGIPLIGSNAFGLVDRGTNLIEVKPITGCNLKCIYCSVDEDRRMVDYVVEKDYLVEEFKRLCETKDCEIEAHIGTQGEPLLYKDLKPLIEGLASADKVKRISIDTNGTMLTEQKVDELVDAGLTRINLSLNTLDENKANTIAGCPYNLKNVVEMAKYIASKANLTIAPVLVPGYNDHEMEDIVNFAKSLKGNVVMGIQNYLHYKGGRNPAKPWTMEHFREYLHELEKKTGEKLVLSREDFLIHDCKGPDNPFRKDEILKVQAVAEGRMPNEKLAVARHRVITVANCKRTGQVKVKITRVKHNIIYGVAI